MEVAVSWTGGLEKTGDGGDIVYTIRHNYCALDIFVELHIFIRTTFFELLMALTPSGSNERLRCYGVHVFISSVVATSSNRSVLDGDYLCVGTPYANGNFCCVAVRLPGVSDAGMHSAELEQPV